MSFVTDTYHNKILKDKKINIKTKYISNRNILERNTDGSHNDDIEKGIICKKEYFINNTLKHTETKFDSRIEFTYISEAEENKEHTCPNCGMRAKLSNFLDGCPYCGTFCNVEYTDKELGNKYHYDLVLKNNKYRIITAIIDYIISTIISFIFIKNTSRTFNNIDIIKIFVYALILSLILYYFFYLYDAYFILGPIKKYKEKENQKQIDFWNKTKIDKKKFFNNINYEISKYYYNITNIIDYDILDYDSYNFYINNQKQYVTIKIDIRLIEYDSNQIKPKYKQETFTFVHNDNGTTDLKAGTNIIKCSNCGASIDINKTHCEYCNTPIKYLQEWILDNKK